MSVRMSITVRDDLKARMDAVTESVNWSATAAAAFEVKLGEIAERKRSTEMQSVVERLRASKITADKDAYQDGFGDGRMWAQTTASVEHLQRLERDETDWSWWDEGDAYSPGETMYFIIEPDEKGDRKAASFFWDDFLEKDQKDERVANCSYVGGFVEGATSVWVQVKDQL